MSYLLWKYDYNKYSRIHYWLMHYCKKNGFCKKCLISGKTEWANISGRYEKNINDYIELCKSCHRKMDNVVMNLGNNTKPGRESNNKGNRYSIQIRKRISENIKIGYKNGRIPWNKGIHISQETKDKISIKNIESWKRRKITGIIDL